VRLKHLADAVELAGRAEAEYEWVNAVLPGRDIQCGIFLQGKV
jgi:hypothetical protein